jgi:hypothetical protein
MESFLESSYALVREFNEIHLANLHRFFVNMPKIVTFCAMNKQFKPGSGQFNLIFDIKEKTNKTIKDKFDYLAKLPIRYLKTSQHALGFVVDSIHEGYEDELICILELEEPQKGKEIVANFETKLLKAYLVCRGNKIQSSEQTYDIKF